MQVVVVVGLERVSLVDYLQHELAAQEQLLGSQSAWRESASRPLRLLVYNQLFRQPEREPQVHSSSVALLAGSLHVWARKQLIQIQEIQDCSLAGRGTRKGVKYWKSPSVSRFGASRGNQTERSAKRKKSTFVFFILSNGREERSEKLDSSCVEVARCVDNGLIGTLRARAVCVTLLPRFHKNRPESWNLSRLLVCFALLLQRSVYCFAKISSC